MNADDLDRLRRLCRELIACIDHDNNGSLVGGQWMGGNGGLTSRETLKATDALRKEVEQMETGE